MYSSYTVAHLLEGNSTLKRFCASNMLRSINNSSCKCSKRSVHSYFEGDYKEAIAALNSLQSNKQTLADPKTRQFPNQPVLKVAQYLSKCGLEVEDLEKRLSLIHVSGTKGKGSTCAYCESILRHSGYKTGFFSSPHLVSVRERIRINGQPISRKKFTIYFWAVYEKLQNDQAIMNGDLRMPPYFQFLTLMAFKVFSEEQVDVAIMEVGIGGEYDCTNIIRNTAVAGISSLGFDHVALLGNTIEEIAWQKAGILKAGSIAITSAAQPQSALQVLQERASERRCSLFIAPELCEYDCNDEIKLGIRGPVQSLNASLALQLANAWLNPQLYRGDAGTMQAAPVFSISNEMLKGLEMCQWLGRTQILQYSPRLFYYLDGAHNTESIKYCVEWFMTLMLTPTQSKKILVFNSTGNRDTREFLKYFIPCQFDYVCFCTNRIDKLVNGNGSSADNWIPTIDENDENKRVERNYNQWLEMNDLAGPENTKIFLNVTQVHQFVDNLSRENHLQVLVAGSLHLVGAFLSVVDPTLKRTRSWANSLHK